MAKIILSMVTEKLVLIYVYNCWKMLGKFEIYQKIFSCDNAFHK